jgi:hypothetical protein
MNSVESVQIERIYHQYDMWEDFMEGMYKKTCFMDEHQMAADCEAILSCPQWLEESMKFVAFNWVRAAEHNLTNMARNRQAWLGQAACCFALGAPEYLTKEAWGRLTEAQQKAANDVADYVIEMWEQRHKRNLHWLKLN